MPSSLRDRQGCPRAIGAEDIVPRYPLVLSRHEERESNEVLAVGDLIPEVAYQGMTTVTVAGRHRPSGRYPILLSFAR